MLGASLLLCIGGWGVLTYVTLPRVRQGASGALADGVGTEVARRLPEAASPGGEPAAGTTVITAEELERALAETFGQGGNGGSVQNLAVDFGPAGVALGLQAEGGQAATYTGVPAVEDGRLVLRDMASDSGVLEFFLPADELGRAIADGVNQALAADGLRLEGLELGEGRIELRTKSVDEGVGP